MRLRRVCGEPRPGAEANSQTCPQISGIAAFFPLSGGRFDELQHLGGLGKVPPALTITTPSASESGAPKRPQEDPKRTHRVTKQKGGGRKAAKTGKNKPTPEEEEQQALDAFMTEIEDDLRDEQLQKLWDKYKSAVFGGMAAIVAVVAGYQYWLGQQEERLAAQADAYASAVVAIEDGNAENALQALGDVAAGGGNYQAIADLRRAALLIEQGQRQDALSLYRSLRNEASVAQAYRDLASVLWAMHGVGVEDTAALEDALYPITAPTNPFSYSALELLAVLAVERSDIDESRSILQDLLDDAGTPSGIRGRAEEMMAVLSGGGLPLLAPSAPAPEIEQPATAGAEAEPGATSSEETP